MTPRGGGAGPGVPAVIVYLIFQRDLVRGPTLGMGK
jgi:ABC-type glycerol-3-phosphate transport system permease component